MLENGQEISAPTDDLEASFGVIRFVLTAISDNLHFSRRDSGPSYYH
jgi:hypothetical protein